MLKHIRGALGLGLAWFVFGAFIGLIVFEGLVDPDGKIADIWPAVLGYPGFFGGVTFFALTRLFERGRRLHEVSLSRAALWGAVAGPLLMAVFAGGIATETIADFKGDRFPWPEIVIASALMAPSFSIAGWASAWMARQVAAPPGTRAESGQPS